jgi:hypothetical protein
MPSKTALKQSSSKLSILKEDDPLFNSLQGYIISSKYVASLTIIGCSYLEKAGNMEENKRHLTS